MAMDFASEAVEQKEWAVQAVLNIRLQQFRGNQRVHRNHKFVAPNPAINQLILRHKFNIGDFVFYLVKMDHFYQGEQSRLQNVAVLFGIW